MTKLNVTLVSLRRGVEPSWNVTIFVECLLQDDGTHLDEFLYPSRVADYVWNMRQRGTYADGIIIMAAATAF